MATSHLRILVTHGEENIITTGENLLARENAVCVKKNFIFIHVMKDFVSHAARPLIVSRAGCYDKGKTEKVC